MKKAIVLLLCCAFFLGGCTQNQVESSTPTAPRQNDALLFSFPKRLTLTSTEEIDAYANGSDVHEGYVAPAEFITLEQIEHLGAFKNGTSFFTTDMEDYGTSYTYDELVDVNGFAFEISISHGTEVDRIDRMISEVYPNKLRVPFGTKSMAQIKADGLGHVKSSGFYYRYSKGRLTSIIASVEGVVFYIRPETEFYEYPEDGERTFLSLLLSTSSRDQRAAMRMLRRCFPKTWVQHTIYYGVPVVILSPAVVFLYRKKRKSRACSCAAPDTPEPPLPDTP